MMRIWPIDCTASGTKVCNTLSTYHHRSFNFTDIYAILEDTCPITYVGDNQPVIFVVILRGLLGAPVWAIYYRICLKEFPMTLSLVYMEVAKRY